MKKLVIFIIVLVLLAGGIYYFSIRNNEFGWKTYRNEQYGFEFKYPSDLGELWTNGDGIESALPLIGFSGGKYSPGLTMDYYRDTESFYDYETHSDSSLETIARVDKTHKGTLVLNMNLNKDTEQELRLITQKIAQTVKFFPVK